jgi:uncharacterized protein with HEPN domain
LPFKYPIGDCLADIIDNAERIARYRAEIDHDTLSSDGLRRDGIERCLERICEAVHRLGDRAEALMPGPPWADIRGMGNRLRHAYHRIEFPTVWKTITTDVPLLEQAARAAFAALPPDAENTS